MDKEQPIAEQKFTCAGCGETFNKGWSDEEALAEKQRDWGDLSLDECAVVCDDCFQKFNEWANQNAGKPA